MRLCGIGGGLTAKQAEREAKEAEVSACERARAKGLATLDAAKATLALATERVLSMSQEDPMWGALEGHSACEASGWCAKNHGGSPLAVSSKRRFVTSEGFWVMYWDKEDEGDGLRWVQCSCGATPDNMCADSTESTTVLPLEATTAPCL